MARLTSSSAVLLIADIDRSVGYYRDMLGFDCHVFGDPPNFVTASRDDVSVLMGLCDEPSKIVPNWKIVDAMWNVYIRVDDVDAIYAELLRRGVPIDYSLYNAPHGFREFGVTDPDGHGIAFGQPIGD